MRKYPQKLTLNLAENISIFIASEKKPLLQSRTELEMNRPGHDAL